MSIKMISVTNVVKNIFLSTEIGKDLHHKFMSNNTPLFTSVELETTSVCNRSCQYCPNYSIKRPQGFMEEKIFYKIIDELSAINFSGRLSPHFYGEPLVDKRIVKLIGYARKQLPRVFIKFFTNGDLLTYNRFLELINAGVDVFRIAQHDVRLTDTLERTLPQIDKSTRKKRIEIVRYYDNDDLLMNRGGLIRVRHDVKMNFCDYVLGITIDFKGNMLLCCQDYLSKNIFGNLNEEKIIDVWSKRNYKEIRDKISSGIWPLEICKTCNGLS